MELMFMLVVAAMCTTTIVQAAGIECCFPDQMEFGLRMQMYMEEDGEKLQHVKGMQAMDFKRKAIAMLYKTTTMDGKVSHIKFLIDFVKDESFFVMIEERVCHPMPVVKALERSQCIKTDRVNHTGSFRFGLGGTAHGYKLRLQDSGSQTDENMSLIVAIKDGQTCVPLMVESNGKRYGKTLSAALAAFDVEETVSDPSIFDVPDFCREGATAEPPQDQLSWKEMPEMQPLVKFVARKKAQSAQQVQDLTCCFPDQVEFGLLMQMFVEREDGEKLLHVKGMQAMDYKRKAMAMLHKGTTMDGKVSHIKFLIDFVKDESFLAVIEERVCHPMPVVKAFERSQCLKAGRVNHTGSFRFGLGETAHGFKLRLQDSGSQTDENMSLIVAIKDGQTCVPLMLESSGKRYGNTLSFVLAGFGVEETVSDPTIFDVPDFCREAATAEPLQDQLSWKEMPEMQPLVKFMARKKAESGLQVQTSKAGISFPSLGLLLVSALLYLAN